MSNQEISKEACARYDKTRGDMGQAHFLMALNLAILKGDSVPEAEVSALAWVRRSYPDFVPRLAAVPVTGR